MAAHASAVTNQFPAQQERALSKLSRLSTALVCALRQRGVPNRDTGLAAEEGIPVFQAAFARWIVQEDKGAADFADLVRQSVLALRAVTGS